MGIMLRRMISAGMKSFVRSGAVSFATVLIMTVTITIIGMLIFLSAILTHTLADIQDKVDINIYFVTGATETDVLNVKDKVDTLPEVASTTYISRDQALTTFRTRHASDQLTLQALDELGTNPLGASLAVKAKDPGQYEGIVKFLSDSPDSALIERVNYYQNKAVIDRLTNAIKATEQAGSLIVLIFALASTIITLATIRLAIYSARDEIAVMRLVGASNMYIRGPFIVAGTLAGALSGLIALVLFFPAAYYAGGALSTWLGGFNLFTYYTDNFPMIFGLLVGSGVILGAIASWLAVRRYLKV